MTRLKNVFNIDSTTLKKWSVILIALFLLEYLLWINLNYYHKPNEIPTGNFIAFVIFIVSCILFLILVSNRHDKWALLIAIHVVMVFFIDRITLDQGNKRYLDSIQETWEFYHKELKYMVIRDKKLEYLAIFQMSLKYPEDNLYDPILSGNCIPIEYGWKLVNDSTEILINVDKLIGFPTQTDTIALKKIYF